jgi:hypothetical protein
VAAATNRDADGILTNEWRPTDFTTSGSRIGCFAAGVDVTAPTARPGGPLQTDFAGTSAAGAIVDHGGQELDVLPGLVQAFDRGPD